MSGYVNALAESLYGAERQHDDLSSFEQALCVNANTPAFVLLECLPST